MFVVRDDNVTLSQREREISLSVTMGEKKIQQRGMYYIEREREIITTSERGIYTTMRERES